MLTFASAGELKAFTELAAAKVVQSEIMQATGKFY